MCSLELEGWKKLSHAHKEGPWYLLGVLFKIFDKDNRPFDMQVNAGPTSMQKHQWFE